MAKDHWALTDRHEPAPSVLPERDEGHLWGDVPRRVLHREPDTATFRDVRDEVAWARSRIPSPQAYAGAADQAGRGTGLDPATVAGCWELFTSAKARTGRVDFADLLEIAASLIEQHSSVAEAVRRRWAHLTVDEYQDTDPAQQRLLDAIMGEGREICAVRDPRQAIYHWKGVDPSYLTDFPRRYPDAKIFDLTRNYPSTPQVLAWANLVAKEPRTRPLVATRPAGPRPSVVSCDDEQAEADGVVRAGRKALAAGTAISELAVLYRFNATKARFEAAFARAGIPTVAAEGGAFFDRDEVRAVLVPFGQAARAIPEQNGLGLLGSFLARAGFDRDRPPDSQGATRARWESHVALFELLEALPGSRGAGASSLLSEVNSLAGRNGGPRAEGFTLATLHQAKGLEWDAVFVVAMTDGAMPSVYAKSTEELTEEERLVHVGLTRARDHLYLSWPATNARGWQNRPSPYLDRFLAAAPARRRPHREARGTGKVSEEPSGRWSSDCPNCAQRLRGMAARGLGVCADCVTSIPGATGNLARALSELVGRAAQEEGRRPEELVGPQAMLRLLYQRPETPEGVAATTGVGLRGKRAETAGRLLKRWASDTLWPS